MLNLKISNEEFRRRVADAMLELLEEYIEPQEEFDFHQFSSELEEITRWQQDLRISLDDLTSIRKRLDNLIPAF